MNGGRRSVKPLAVIANDDGSFEGLDRRLELATLAPSRPEVRLEDARGRHS
jgi:hypothetical protein